MIGIAGARKAGETTPAGAATARTLARARAAPLARNRIGRPFYKCILVLPVRDLASHGAHGHFELSSAVIESVRKPCIFLTGE